MLTENEAFCIPRFQKHCYYSDEKNPWSILWVHFKGEDTQYFPLDDCKIVKFKSSYASNQMMFLFDLLFRVLEGNYTLGNFIYISQILSVILAETYHREKKEDTVEQLAGKAMTVLMIDVYGPQKKPFGYLTEAIDQLLENEIYVATGGSRRCAYWGELLIAAARTKKAAGAVVNG